jgi:hypothetical protein
MRLSVTRLSIEMVLSPSSFGVTGACLNGRITSATAGILSYATSGGYPVQNTQEKLRCREAALFAQGDPGTSNGIVIEPNMSIPGTSINCCTAKPTIDKMVYVTMNSKVYPIKLINFRRQWWQPYYFQNIQQIA